MYAEQLQKVIFHQILYFSQVIANVYITMKYQQREIK